MGSQLTYEKVVSKINDKIDLIRRFGKDTTEYESALEQIINGEINLPPYLEHSNSKGSAVLKKDLQFEEKMKSLNELLEKLESNENAIKLHIKNESLKNAISNFKIGDSLSEILKQGKSLIKLLNDIEFQGDSEKNYSSDIYKTIYEIIKLELISVGSSSLLNYIIKNDKGIEFINDCVREDLSHLDLNASDNKDIKSKVLELSSIGIDYNFANESLILMIILKTDDRVVDSIKIRIDKLKDIEKEYEEESSKAKDLINNCNHLNSLAKDKRKKARIGALITSLMILLNGLGYTVGNFIAKNANTDTQYMTTREVYDTYTGQTRVEKELEYKSSENRVYIHDYSEVNSNGSRNKKIYKIDPLEFETAEDYKDIDLSNETAINNSTINYSSIDQLTRDEYRAIETVTYAEEPNLNFDEESYQNTMKTIFTFVLIMGGINSLLFLRYLIIAISNNKRIKNNDKTIKQNTNMQSVYDNWIKYNKTKIKELEELEKDTKVLTKEKYLREIHNK